MLKKNIYIYVAKRDTNIEQKMGDIKRLFISQFYALS